MKLYDLLGFQSNQLAHQDGDKLSEFIKGFLELERQKKVCQANLVPLVPNHCGQRLVVVPTRGVT